MPRPMPTLTKPDHDHLDDFEDLDDLDDLDASTTSTTSTDDASIQLFAIHALG
jgi:hypothetical protein